MLKHRVSNAGAHAHLTTAHISAPTLQPVGQQAGMTQNQPIVTKPPRVPGLDSSASSSLSTTPSETNGSFVPVPQGSKPTLTLTIPDNSTPPTDPLPPLPIDAYSPYNAYAHVNNDPYNDPQYTTVQDIHNDIPDEFPPVPDDLPTYTDYDQIDGHSVNYNGVTSVSGQGHVQGQMSGEYTEYQAGEGFQSELSNEYNIAASNNIVPSTHVEQWQANGVPGSSQQPSEQEAIRIMTEKYDSPGNIAIPSGNMEMPPQLSPLESPSQEGATLSFADIMMSQKYRDGVTEQDLLQADTFYRSHKSEVHVCGCLANMYLGSTKAAVTNDQWVFTATGIPLLLLDTGEHHRQRKLYIVLAEKGTGFTLWRDVIDNLTNYKTPNANFHTMHISKDHNKLAGLSFDEADKAREFFAQLDKLTSDPNDELLQIGKGKKKKKSVKEKKKKTKLPKKTEISQPCCFMHVTKLDRPLTESDTVTPNSANTPKNSNDISHPFNFQHGTATPTKTGSRGNDVSGSDNLLSLMGSKLTLNSTSSVDSGLSDDRSTRTTAS